MVPPSGASNRYNNALGYYNYYKRVVSFNLELSILCREVIREEAVLSTTYGSVKSFTV